MRTARVIVVAVALTVALSACRDSSRDYTISPPAEPATTSSSAVAPAGTVPLVTGAPTAAAGDGNVAPVIDAEQLPLAGGAAGLPADSGEGPVAVRAAFATVIDLDVPFDRKAPHLEQASGLNAVHDQYVALVRPLAGQLGVQMGEIAVAGDQASFVFDLVKADGGVLAPGLAGEAVLREGVWQVTRRSFCSTLALGGLRCPEPA